MDLAALVSGGKDSAYAIHLASKDHNVKTLVSIHSRNEESYMYHTPNIHMTEEFSKACEIPLVVETSSGEKELELEDMRRALSGLDVDGVVVGAIESEYQRKRVEEICSSLGLEMIAPLWQADPLSLMTEMIGLMEIMIVHVSCLGLDESWLGRILDESALEELKVLNKKYRIHIAGEGGEYETLVLNAPFFKRRIILGATEKIWLGDRGTLKISCP
ncbi:MAG: TIGR00289 family protein [Halobacteriota archaeon]|nr:TIGR00289 family protein [Halobacteriota archaeon]